MVGAGEDARRVLEAFGLDGHNVHKITFELEAGKPAVLRVERHVPADTALAVVFEQYVLVKREVWEALSGTR